MRAKKRKKIKFSNKKLMLLLLVIIIIFLIFLLIEKIVLSKNYDTSYSYKNISHIDDIKNSKEKNDKDGYKTIGWIDLYDTDINMPILKIDDDFEDRISFNKFAWTDGDEKFYNFITIYGHNIANVGIPSIDGKYFYRFEELMAFIYKDFAEKHRYFQITIDNKDYIYEIFSVNFVDSFDAYQLPSGDISKSKMHKYLKDFIDDSIYDYKIKVNEDDDIAVLTTCTRMFSKKNETSKDSLIVVGKRVDKDEKNYTLKKSSKYEKVEKVLRGDSYVS